MPAPTIALYYDDDAYREKLKQSKPQRAGQPVGLMGRQVAGHQFLDAYLSYGSFDQLVAVVSHEKAGQSLFDTCKQHPSSRARARRLKIVQHSSFSDTFAEGPPADILHLPQPIDARFAWSRAQTSPHGFALSGVTHTLCSLRTIEMLRGLLTAPYRSYDRLICTSRAVVEMVRSVTDAYGEYLAEQHGGQPRRLCPLELIPLGVNTERFRPASAVQRASARKRLAIAGDEPAILFVGRLAHHAKAHPFAMFRALEIAARQIDDRVHLILAGWAASTKTLQTFRDAARRFAPGIRTSIVDGTDAQLRQQVWHAADIFTSLSDNIQETFGLVIVEAMASGLPVVATDWNGYRDLVLHEQTGWLVPTAMVQDATTQATLKLLTGEINYDHFLASTSQCVAVDIAAAADAFTALLQNEDLRRRMGAAGRQRSLEHFAWQKIIPRYEQLWRQQDTERRTILGYDPARPRHLGPAAYSAPERSFAGYPSAWVGDQSRLVASAQAASRLAELLHLGITSLRANDRCGDAAVLQKVLQRAQEPIQLSLLEQAFTDHGIDHRRTRATVAWMLKYDLLRVADPLRLETMLPQSAANDDTERAQLTFVVTCMGRLEFLQRSLPRLVQQPRSNVIVVDWSCPDNAGDWIEEHYPQVEIVRCPGHSFFDRSGAKNAGAWKVETPWLCLIDADIIVHEEFSERLMEQLQTGHFYRANILTEGTGGTLVIRYADFAKVGGHDLRFVGWGDEDDDLRDALRFAGVGERYFSADLVTHIDHDDVARMQFHERVDRHHSHMVNRMYRAVKWDLARLNLALPTDQQLTELYTQLEQRVQSAIAQGAVEDFLFDAGSMKWTPIKASCQRSLTYRLRFDDA